MLQRTYLHSGWEFAEKSWPGGRIATVATGWLPAQVPGHVHLDLVENGVILDPNKRMGELGCQWVDQKDWTYRNTFQWAPREGLPTRFLRFEGLDTVCSLFLNGEHLADHDNMFLPLELDVTDHLLEGSNELRVEFQSAVRVGEERRRQYFSKEGLGDDVANFDERSFVRKAQYMFGWDWGPRLVSCGIWKPVSLLEYAARITGVTVVQEALEDGGFALHVAADCVGEAAISIYGYFGEDEAQVLSGAEGTVYIGNPVKWRPRISDFGWEVTVRVIAESVSGALETHDLVDTRLGIVETKLLRQPDESGESFEFEVNGERVWARGANWIPDSSFPSTVDQNQYRDRLTKARNMGFNLLRVWGGGLYESDHFYDLCDELGILVWQDFPFACAYYPDDEYWQEIVRVEAEANIKRLRHHPCLALWCGNNENLMMAEGKWGGASRQPERLHGENLYEKTLPRALAALDPARSYIATSPIGSEPAHCNSNSDHFGDQHYWDVWHGRGDWRNYADSHGRFSSEFGFCSSCNLPVWKSTLGHIDWSPHSDVVKWHDRTGKDHETFHNLVMLHYPEPATLEDWVYFSQLNQRDAMRFGIEHYRRSPECRGALVWQFNDCWPVQSWSIIDSDGAYKAIAYELSRLYADSLLSIVRENEKFSVWVVNDGVYPVSADVTVAAVELSTGKVLREWTGKAHAMPDSRQALLTGSLSGLAAPDVLLFASSFDMNAWQLLSEPKSARFGDARPLLVSTHPDGAVVLRLDRPVVDLMLTCNGDPMPFKNNFTTSLAGDVLIPVSSRLGEIGARSLAGVHEVRVVRGPM